MPSGWATFDFVATSPNIVWSCSLPRGRVADTRSASGEIPPDWRKRASVLIDSWTAPLKEDLGERRHKCEQFNKKVKTVSNKYICPRPTLSFHHSCSATRQNCWRQHLVPLTKNRIPSPMNAQVNFRVTRVLPMSIHILCLSNGNCCFVLLSRVN